MEKGRVGAGNGHQVLIRGVLAGGSGQWRDRAGLVTAGQADAAG